MEWYFENEVNDLMVPKKYEQPEMVSSPDSWSQWGITAFGASDFTKKNPTTTHEQLAFNASKDFQHESQNSSNSTIYNDGVWNNQAYYQQFTDEEARINHMDDLFFNSLLEEDPTKSSVEFPEDEILANEVDALKGEMSNSRNIPCQGQSMGSSQYLQTNEFSLPLDWDNNEVSSSCLLPEQYASDETSMEESVLHELERATSQFTNKTRICFRDALYRLAESSKQPFNSCHDTEPMLISNNGPSRVCEMENAESKTNAIDRAIANLMFSKMAFDDNELEQQA